MSAPRPRTPWWQLLVLALVLAAVEWLVEYRSESAAHDAALLAADAAADAARIQLDALGPLEDRGGTWYAGDAPVERTGFRKVSGFAVRVSTDASACPIPGAEQSVLGARTHASGYAKVDGQWWVSRCDPLVDRHGQVGGLIAVVAEARGFAGNPWRVRAALVPTLLLLFGVAAAQFLQTVRARSALWAAEQTIQEQNARNEAAAEMLRVRDEELESEVSFAEGALYDAEAANREKTSFLANVSHELRTPLNAVIGYGEVLQDEVAPHHREDVRRLLDAARGLLVMIGDVLELTQIETGSFDLTLQAFDLRVLLEETAAAAQPKYEKRSASLRLEMDPAVDWMVADPARVRQALDLLLAGASGLVAGGEAVFLVYPFEGDEGGERVAFQVTAANVQMDDAALARVFEPFVAAGAGVSLTIVRRLTERMGGDASAASSEGAGTTFTVVLPKELQVETAST